MNYLLRGPYAGDFSPSSDIGIPTSAHKLNADQVRLDPQPSFPPDYKFLDATTGQPFDLAAFLKEPTPPNHKLNADQTVAVATDVFWNEDMAACPRGCKLQLLGAGGVAVYGDYHGDPFWQAWAPLPKRRKS